MMLTQTNVLYALTGYMLAYSWNMMWLDVVALLPVVVLAMEHMLRTGKMHGTYEQLIQPVYYMEALFRSMQTGDKIEVAQALVD